MSKSIEITNLTNNQLYGFRMFPRNLKGQYQTEIDGATATATPKAIPPIFGEATWEQINLASTTNTIPSTWHIGDTKDITLTTGETLTMQIYGFNHDDLASGGKAGITMGMKNVMYERMGIYETNMINTNYSNSDLSNKLNNNILNSFPIGLKNVVKNVNKRTSMGSRSTQISVNSLKVFLFSVVELTGNIHGSVTGEGTMYPIFNDKTNYMKYSENYQGYSNMWWTRSPALANSSSFCYMGKTGYVSYYGSTGTIDVCFGFCI